jgi:hypothetical protein
VIQAGEDDTTVLETPSFGFTLQNLHLLDGFRDRRAQLPSDNLAIFISGRPGRSTQSVDLEVWVSGEQLDESLADGAYRVRFNLVGDDGFRLVEGDYGHSRQLMFCLADGHFD